MIIAPQGPFGGNRKAPVAQFAQTDFITMGMQSFGSSTTKRWTQILGEKWDKATLQGLKISGWSDSTCTLGVINITAYSPQFNGSGVALVEDVLATSLIKSQTLGDSKLYAKWTIQIAASTTSQAAKTQSVFWLDFTDAQKLYALATYDQLYIDIAVTFSGGAAIELNPQLEVMPFMAD
jgi:hypothetical protein